MIIDSPIISGSYLSTGSLSQTGNVSITGSLTATAGVSGSFSGSGADLFGIPAAGIVGLNLSQISSGSVSASISPNQGLLINTSVSASNFSGSFSGSGANLFGIPASGITGLNLSQISSGSVSASISPNQGLLINTSVSASNFTGSFTGSLTGIATSASYASFALTSSYSLGGSGFPFSGSAIITGSLIVSGSGLTITGSVAISTLTTGSGVRYVIADQNGLLSAQTASAAIFTTQQVVSTANQTTFPITNGYSTGYVTVFVNGTKLSADEYVDTSGTNIIFLTGSTAGDVVEFQKYLPASGVSNNTLRTVNYFTAILGQTNFTVNYTPGLLDVFYNGAKLDNTEYTAANGTSITLATGSNAGDRLEVDVYSYQVGAFSGIGGTGAANQLAYFNTSNSITGSNAFTVSGSAIIITGSLIVSGSGTLINIGPAVFSGSVTAVGGFSGSFSGNADSASLAQNSLLLQGTGSIGFATTASLLAVSSSQQQISSSLLTLTASYTALSSSYTALSGSYNTFSGSASTRITANSSSIQQVSSSQQQISSSLLNVIANYATTGSNSFRANQSITGSLVVSSTITAQTLVVQTVTSSIVYSSGSNIFGSALGDRQTFTGSIQASGSSSHFFMGGSVGIGVTNPGVTLEVNGYGKFTGIGINSTPSSIGTNPNYVRLTNTGGDLYIGQEGSTSGTFFNGSLAYDSVLYSGRPYNFIINGVSRMYISSSGNVGIATTSPSAKLDIYAGADATSNLVLWGQTIRNEGNGAATGYGAGLKLKISSDGTPNEVYKWAGIAAVAGTGYSNRTDLALYSNAASTADATEKMRITGDGYVGINTTSLPAFAANSSILKIGSQAIFGYFGSGANGETWITNNAYYDGSWKGINTAAAQIIKLNDNNDIRIFNDASVTAATAFTPTERMRITSGGAIFNKAALGGYTSFIGVIGPGNVGNRYLHARINTIGSMMVWIKIFGYSYVNAILEGIGGGYVDGSTGQLAQNFNNGSIPIIHQNGSYIEVVVDTVGTGTSNRWGNITFLGGTDNIATIQPLEIMTYSWTSTTTRVY